MLLQASISFRSSKESISKPSPSICKIPPLAKHSVIQTHFLREHTHKIIPPIYAPLPPKPHSVKPTMKQNTEKDHRKPCTLCTTPRDVLVRCQIDNTGKWHFVCPGACWKRVSGGVVDGDKSEAHKWYRYGGMWKNKYEAVSAKKPKGVGVPKRKEVVGGEEDGAEGDG